MTMVRTVLGDRPAESLGRTDYHEHLFQISPLLPGDELDDEQRSGDEAQSLYDAGIHAMVEATPTGLGRDPSAVARISARTGLQIIATTGAHREPHYGSGHWLIDQTVDQLTARFTSEIRTGLPVSDTPARTDLALGPTGEPVRAGLIKAGIGYWSMTRFERRVLEAVARTQRETDAPVMVHLEHGSAAFEVVELLGALGVPAHKIALAHIDRNPDPGLHADLAAVGCYLGYDGFARSKDWPDSVLLDCLLAAVERGARDRILLGGDVARRTRYIAYDGLPGLAYLPKRFIPTLERTAGTELADAVLRSNPARWLGHL